jgi:hypothetical protein
MNKVAINLKDLKALSIHAKKVGTEREWMDIALEWMEVADKKIDGLTRKDVTCPKCHIIYTAAGGPFKAYLDERKAYREYERLRDMDDGIDYSIVTFRVTRNGKKCMIDK